MLLLENGRLITGDEKEPFIENGAVAIEGDSILEIGESGCLLEKYPDAERIDAEGGVIMPGLINAHSHLRSVFAKGINTGAPQKTYLQVLDGQWWAVDRKMKLEDTRAAADCAFIRSVENGVTTVFEQHAAYGETPGSLFAIEESAKALGVRTCLCYEISDREGEKKMKQAVKENVEYINSVREKKDESRAAIMGLHAQFTLSDQTLDYISSKTPSGAGCCVHVAEAALDVTESLNKHGIRPVFRLYDFGLIGRNTICLDCTHISEREMDVLKNNDSMIVHSPESNMANAVGCPPILKMTEKGILLGLGTDSCGFDMLGSMRAADLLHKHELCDPLAAEKELQGMLFAGNRAIADRFFSRPLGILRRGAHADIIVLDYSPAIPMTAENLSYHLLCGMTGGMTDTVIIGGEVRMRHRELIGIDKEAAFAHARERAQELQKKLRPKK